MMGNSNFGMNLGKALQEKEWTQEHFANLVDVSSATVSAWIWEQRSPSLNNFKVICATLNISADQLLFGKPGRRLDWLHSNENMLEIERRVGIEDPGSEEIWIMSTTLENDIPGGIAEKGVIENARKGLKYLYIVPKNVPKVRNNVDKLKFGTFKGLENSYAVIELPDFAKYVIYDNAAVYNPLGKGRLKTEVYFELPLGGNFWWVKVHESNVDRFLGQIKYLMDRASSG